MMVIKHPMDILVLLSKIYIGLNKNYINTILNSHDYNKYLYELVFFVIKNLYLMCFRLHLYIINTIFYNIYM